MNQPAHSNSNQKKKARILTVEEADAERLNMTYEQRFDLLMKLIRINKMMKQAKIRSANGF